MKTKPYPTAKDLQRRRRGVVLIVGAILGIATIAAAVVIPHIV